MLNGRGYNIIIVNSDVLTTLSQMSTYVIKTLDDALIRASEKTKNRFGKTVYDMYSGSFNNLNISELITDDHYLPLMFGDYQINIALFVMLSDFMVIYMSPKPQRKSGCELVYKHLFDAENFKMPTADRINMLIDGDYDHFKRSSVANFFGANTSNKINSAYLKCRHHQATGLNVNAQIFEAPSRHREVIEPPAITCGFFQDQIISAFPPPETYAKKIKSKPKKEATEKPKNTKPPLVVDIEELYKMIEDMPSTNYGNKILNFVPKALGRYLAKGRSC